MRPLRSVLFFLGLSAFAAVLAACSNSFWYRNPQVAGSYTCPPQASAPCPPVQQPCPPVQQPVAPCPPSPCPPSSAPYVAAPSPGPSYAYPRAEAPCPAVPAIPPSEPPAGASAPSAPFFAGGPTVEDEQVFILVNQVRQGRGLRPLAWSPLLHRAAFEHSEEQCRHGYMGHGSPDPSRRTLLQRVQLAGYDGRCFGEVVAWGYKTPQAVVEGWMNSRDHRAILVDRDLTEVGFSRVGDYWTGNFGTPRRPQPSATGVPPARPPATRAPAPEAPSAYVAPAPAPPVRQYFQPAPRAVPEPIPQPIRRVPSRGG